MGIEIEEVHTEVENPSGPNSAGEEKQPPFESEAVQDREAERMLADQIQHLEKRQLRLLAD
jgi:hypothetical protein